MKTKEKLGVSDGTRTRDIQNHNLELYQLSYAHHSIEEQRAPISTVRCDRYEARFRLL